MNKDFLNKIIETYSPSGSEENLQKLIMSHMQDIASFKTDSTGNLTSIINEDCDYKVMLCAHSDEISLIVDGYNGDGTLKVSKNGGIFPLHYVASHVKIVTPNGEFNGVVGSNHAMVKKEVNVDDLFVDLGIRDVKRVKEMVPLGSYVVHSSTLTNLSDDYFAARALDDRLGVFIILEALRKAKKMGAKVGVYATSSTGEETTMRGAYYAASQIKPDFAIVVDVTYASDYPGGQESHFDVEVGKGGVICIGSLPHKKLNEKLKETAKKLNLPYQEEVWPGRTSTDGDTILKTNEGTPIVLFSIPLRYMHSPIEVASYSDVSSMIEILANFLNDIDEPIDLKRF